MHVNCLDTVSWDADQYETGRDRNRETNERDILTAVQLIYSLLSCVNMLFVMTVPKFRKSALPPIFRTLIAARSRRPQFQRRNLSCDIQFHTTLIIWPLHSVLQLRSSLSIRKALSTHISILFQGPVLRHTVTSTQYCVPSIYSVSSIVTFVVMKRKFHRKKRMWFYQNHWRQYNTIRFKPKKRSVILLLRYLLQICYYTKLKEVNK